MWPCLLLKYCACDGVVSCQSTAPATGLSFWNIGPAALRDLLNTPRSPAAMLRQCEMDWSCHMLRYSVPQQHCRRGCGGSVLPAQKLSGEKMQDHMEVRPWRPHGMFFISQERRNISRTKICMCFEVKVPHGACVSWKQWMSWLVIIASVFWFQIIQSWRVLVVLVVQLVSRHSCVADRLPVVVWFPSGPRVRLKTVDPPKGNGLGQKKISLDVYFVDSRAREPRFVLVPSRFPSEAWPRAGLGEPRSASNANKPASSWPLNRAEKSAQNMAAIERPRQ